MCLWAIGFRGEPLLLTHTLPWLNSNNARLMAHIITHITDIDLENVLPENLDKDLTIEENTSEDHSLTLFHTSALKVWLAEYIVTTKNNQKLCRGKELTRTSAKECLGEGTQPQRWQAALFLSREKVTSKKTVSSIQSSAEHSSE